jgi:hypothetical protein
LVKLLGAVLILVASVGVHTGTNRSQNDVVDPPPAVHGEICTYCREYPTGEDTEDLCDWCFMHKVPFSR